MLIAKLSNGTLILGLSRINVDRLVGGEPISITEASHGLALPEGWTQIGIVYGETEQTIADDLRAMSRGIQ